MKHTKGTWEPCKYGTRPNLKNAVVVWHEDYHTPIAKCVGDKSQANANLIASAPEMLGALKEVLRWIQHSDYEYNKHLVKVCRKAIAKAEGSAS